MIEELNGSYMNRALFFHPSPGTPGEGWEGAGALLV